MKKFILSIATLGFAFAISMTTIVQAQIPSADKNKAQRLPNTPLPQRPSPWNHPERFTKVMSNYDTAIKYSRIRMETNQPPTKKGAVKMPVRREQ